MKKGKLFLFVILLLSVACQNDSSTEEKPKGEPKNGFVEYDLSSKDIPVVVEAPMGAEIKSGVGNGGLGGVETINYEIVKGDFLLDINYVKGAEYLKDNLIEGEKQFAREDLIGFADFVVEDEMGFIYKLETEEGVDYGFYHLLLKDGHPIEFGVGLSYSHFTLEQVETMYNAAKNAR